MGLLFIVIHSHHCYTTTAIARLRFQRNENISMFLWEQQRQDFAMCLQNSKLVSAKTLFSCGYLKFSYGLTLKWYLSVIHKILIEFVWWHYLYRGSLYIYKLFCVSYNQNTVLNYGERTCLLNVVICELLRAFIQYSVFKASQSSVEFSSLI